MKKISGISVFVIVMTLMASQVFTTPMGMFQAPVNYEAANMSYSVAIEDLNGDNTPDLIVANGGGDNVSILLGAGDGTFLTAINYRAGDYPYSVAVEDLNGDGEPDLAVANAWGDNVSILIGNGDGTFQTPINFGAGNYPRSIVIEDLNGDGTPDLAVTNFISDNVSILLGHGDGTFQTAGNYGTGDGPYSVAIEDLNGDGKLDLTVAHENSNYVSILLGNGDGTFQTRVDYIAGDTPRSVAIKDLNGDGNPDLAVTNTGGNNVSILLGNGDGSFQAAIDYETGSRPSSIAIEDLNGDCEPDLAVANQGSDDVSILLGNGDGTFQAAVQTPVIYRDSGFSRPKSIAIEDLNNDGAPDLVTANFISDNVSVFLAIFSPSSEICDGIDNDEDGLTDENTTTEICNLVDDDCNGLTDEGFIVSTETCNGVDDDCNGQIDEGLGVTTCGTTGACRVTVANCLGGTPQACVPRAPSSEIHNGIDDDCDGQTDEGVSTPTTGALYMVDALELSNPGGWGTSLKTFDDIVSAGTGQTIVFDVWTDIGAMPDPTGGGVAIDFTADSDKAVITNGWAFATGLGGPLLPGPWSIGVIVFPSPAMGLATLASQVDPPIPPDAGNDIILARFEVVIQKTIPFDITFKDIHSSTQWQPSPPWVDTLVARKIVTVNWECSAYEYCFETPAIDDDCDGLTDEGCSVGGLTDRCHGDLNADLGVDASDLNMFLVDFGSRFPFLNPCTGGDPCEGDLDCNIGVDAGDLNIFMGDFGARFPFSNPCPVESGVTSDWILCYPCL